MDNDQKLFFYLLDSEMAESNYFPQDSYNQFEHQVVLSQLWCQKRHHSI